MTTTAVMPAGAGMTAGASEGRCKRAGCGSPLPPGERGRVAAVLQRRVPHPALQRDARAGGAAGAPGGRAGGHGGEAARVHRNVPVSDTLITSCQSASVISSTGATLIYVRHDGGAARVARILAHTPGRFRVRRHPSTSTRAF